MPVRQRGYLNDSASMVRGIGKISSRPSAPKVVPSNTITIFTGWYLSVHPHLLLIFGKAIWNSSPNSIHKANFPYGKFMADREKCRP
jgi:hypothetical protein